MTEQDLPEVEAWLRRPHVARWWTPDTTAEAEIAKYRQRVRQGRTSATHMLIVTLDGTSVGWCQWYRWADYPAHAVAMGARDGEIGIDYAIGDLRQVGRGLGTALIATLVAEIRRRYPGAGILADPDVANIASRRVLEKNGFHLVAADAMVAEPSDPARAIYRLSLVVAAFEPSPPRPAISLSVPFYPADTMTSRAWAARSCPLCASGAPVMRR
jgi:aminoglycoside 6'-N-acetyltransferase